MLIMFPFADCSFLEAIGKLATLPVSISCVVHAQKLTPLGDNRPLLCAETGCTIHCKIFSGRCNALVQVCVTDLH